MSITASVSVWRYYICFIVGCSSLFPSLITAQLLDASKDPLSLEDESEAYLSDQRDDKNEFDDYDVFAPAKITRSVRAKYDPTYRWLGIGKRDGQAPRPKFGQNYKWIGLGKRAADDSNGRKFSPNYKWIGLGKREPLVVSKYNPGYKWIGLGKRYAPYAASFRFKELFHVQNDDTNKNRISRTSTGSLAPAAVTNPRRPWNAFYSVVTKKYQGGSSVVNNDDEGVFAIREEQPIVDAQPNSAFVGITTTAPPVTIIDASSTPGRPFVRGGYEPIYRFIGLG